MLDKHGTSNALRRETIQTISEVEVMENKVDKSCGRPFTGKYRKTSSEIDKDKEPIMVCAVHADVVH